MTEFYGYEDDDIVVGTSGDDFIYTQGGNDTISAGNGADDINAGEGADIVDGGAGNDRITSEEDTSVDILTGGTGADTFNFYLSPAASRLQYLDRITDFSQSSGDRIDLQSSDIRWGGAITTPGFTLSQDAILPGISNDMVTAWTWSNAGISYLIVDRNRNNRLEATDFVIRFDNGAVITTSAFVAGTISSVVFGTAGSDTWVGTAGADEYRGYGGGDDISGGGNDDILDGGTGDDLLRGNAGDDILIGDVGNDELHGGDGNDTLYAAFRYNTSLTDEGYTNLLYGDDGDDILVAGDGHDVLEGGLGNDIINSRDDDVGTGGDILRGGDGGDIIISNGDWVDGGAGDDLIRVASGYDASGSTITGGSGADLFEVYPQANFSAQSFSVITDFNASEGDALRLGVFSTPLILRGEVDDPAFSLTEGAAFSASDYGPGFVQIWTWRDTELTYVIIDLDEDSRLGEGDFVLSFEGSFAVTADIFEANTLAAPNIGTAADDVFIGSAGIDTYAGVNGADTISGGDGDDVLQGNNGNDLVQGDAGRDDIAGGNGDDTLYGGTGDDTITGGSGSDLIYGGSGDDRIDASGYHLADVDDVTSVNVIYGEAGNDQISGGWSHYDELHGGDGNDGIFGTGFLWGDAGHDNLTSGNWSSTLDGGSGNDFLRAGWSDDVLIGGIGNDNLQGGFGDDELIGGSGNDFMLGDNGADSMSGGTGDDRYYVDNVNDRVIEAQDQGIDTVYSSISFSLADQYAEILLLEGQAIWGEGNALDNELFGSWQDNVLTGFGGDDVLDGANGQDTLIGGLGNDTYYVDNAGDVVTEDNVIGVDKVISSISYVLGANVENLTLSGSASINGRGNALANVLMGNAGANVLNGLAGADTMSGMGGADTYTVDNIGDVVVEQNVIGADTVLSSITYTLGSWVENLTLTGTANINGSGNTLANFILGNTGNNVLNGVAGADRMQGLGGADTYYVDNAGDVVIEQNVAGIDTIYSTVTHTLGAYVENLTLTGTAAINATGNTLANTIVGSTANNVINGGAGADRMQGLAGSDNYFVDNIGDVVIEQNVVGVDVVNSSISYTLGSWVENLNLTGTAAINGTGNVLANTIVGNTADNVINGGTGADRMLGLAGNDTYYVDNVGDSVTEQNVVGRDIVISTVSFTLGSYVENLTLSGSAAINGTGNALANVLSGNGAANTLNGAVGADRLFGGVGADTLTGGADADTFVYTNLNQSTLSVFDRITDLTSADRIDLSAIDANSSTGGNQAFSIVNAFTNVAGQMTLDYAAGTNLTTILMDINGDGVADMKIAVTGNHEAYANFVF